MSKKDDTNIFQSELKDNILCDSTQNCPLSIVLLCALSHKLHSLLCMGSATFKLRKGINTYCIYMPLLQITQE